MGRHSLRRRLYCRAPDPEVHIRPLSASQSLTLWLPTAGPEVRRVLQIVCMHDRTLTPARWLCVFLTALGGLGCTVLCFYGLAQCFPPRGLHAASQKRCALVGSCDLSWLCTARLRPVMLRWLDISRRAPVKVVNRRGHGQHGRICFIRWNSKLRQRSCVRR